MEDAQIVALFWDRDEAAIARTDAAYGRSLYRLSDRILRCPEDAQECVNDTYWKAWESIPPQRPMHLFAYLAKLCRNLSLTRLDWNQAAKRSAPVVELTREMEACIPDQAAERQLEGTELGRLLDCFLGSLSPESRRIFLRRYWYADAIGDIARRYGISQSKVKTRLYRTRNQLKAFLEQEGIRV